MTDKQCVVAEIEELRRRCLRVHALLNRLPDCDYRRLAIENLKAIHADSGQVLAFVAAIAEVNPVQA